MFKGLFEKVNTWFTGKVDAAVNNAVNKTSQAVTDKAAEIATSKVETLWDWVVHFVVTGESVLTIITIVFILLWMLGMDRFGMYAKWLFGIYFLIWVVISA